MYTNVVTLQAQTWEHIIPSFSDGKTFDDVTDITFTTESLGWLTTASSRSLNSRIYRTKDGGKNWHLVKESHGGISTAHLFIIDSLHCWGFGGSPELIFTHDGGATWDSATIISKKNTYGIGRLYFFNSNEGMIINKYSRLTSDGGRTWYDGDTTNIFDTPFDVFFTNRNLGWMVSWFNQITTDAGYIANTTDGGYSWHYQNYNTARLGKVHFIDSLKGFALGVFEFSRISAIYQTTNGGKRWDWSETPDKKIATGIGFLNESHGWLSGGNRILRTTNGGSTWEVQVSDIGQVSLGRMFVFRDDKIACIVARHPDMKTYSFYRADLNLLDNIKEDKQAQKVSNRLLTNYPNPFSNHTTIKYQDLSKLESITLKLYDCFGREVLDLSDQINENPEVTIFNSQLPKSGIYFYRLTVGNISQTRMIVMVR